MPFSAHDRIALRRQGLVVEAHFVAVLDQGDGSRVSYVVAPGSGVISARVLGCNVRPPLSPAARAASRYLDRQFSAAA